MAVSRVRITDAIMNMCVRVCAQEKQNEARYLRDHKEELIEELATTIVQKVGYGIFSSLLFSCYIEVITFCNYIQE